MEKYDHAKFIIERFDHYYDSVNNKGAFFIGLNTFIFSGISVGYLTLHNKIFSNWGIWLLLLALFFSCILSICFTVSALMPFLKDNHNKNDSPSLLYFGGIARHELSHFKDKFNSINDAVIMEDLVQQAYCLAKGLDRKYKNLKKAGVFVIMQFIVMVPLIFLIVNYMK